MRKSQDAERSPDEGEGGRSGCLHGSPEEQRCFDAFASHREERHEHEPPACSGEVPVDVRSQGAAQVACGLQHPEDHPGDKTRRDDGKRASDGILSLGAQPVRPESEDCTDGECEHDGQTDADPDAAEHVTATDLDHVGHEDTDDECGLEALAQADEKVCEHGRFLF
jgi:hypothetical protein